MIDINSMEEYALTIGMLISFVGLIVCIVISRGTIVDALRKAGLKKRHLFYALVPVAVFLAIELLMVQPTQQLFFDDVIYQNMAQNILNSGQAWMCDFGTQYACYIGEIFHEPIGASFNIAISFAVLGVSRGAAYAADIAISIVAIIATFFATLLMFRDRKVAFFSELLLALSPILLIWAFPTNSDIYTLAYSMLALFFVVLFAYKKNIATFALAGFSLILANYMKVDESVLIVVMIIVYLFLDDQKIINSIKKNLKLLTNNYLNTKVLVLVLLFAISIAPQFIYTVYTATQNGGFGYQGAYLPNSCNPSQSVPASSSFNIQNFEFNICSNLLFWVNAFQSQYVIQPVAFTLLAVAGAIIMAFYNKNAFFAIGIWFAAFFILYTSFYAGAVTFGVDWRFMISVIAQASIFGGYACAAIVDSAGGVARMLSTAGNKARKAAAKLRAQRYGQAMGCIAVLAVMSYSIYALAPLLSVNPSQISQAGNARFYENFVYQSVNAIPQSCIVLSYDPTLFNLNGRASAQLSYLYDPSIYSQISAEYQCKVVDYGYWCYTPGNVCQNLNQSYTLKPIVTATYNGSYGSGTTVYGFYYLSNKTA